MKERAGECRPSFLSEQRRAKIHAASEETHMSKLKLVFATALLFGGLVTTASAMPMAPLAADAVSGVDQVRMVCNAWGRCWWRPNYYRGGYDPRFYGGYGPRFYGGYGGHRRGWGGRRW